MISSQGIWVDRLGRGSIIGCVGKSGNFVRFSKVCRSCVTEGLWRSYGNWPRGVVSGDSGYIKEVGWALGRPSLALSVRLGEDPRGFVGKFQAIPGGDGKPFGVAQK